MASHQESEVISDAAREKEFYRYYQPRRYGLDFSPAQAGPNSSPDKALTAFCQLAALRLNARRSQISFFDRKNQYILAEATKSSSIQDGVAEDEEDKLWSGITCLCRESSICVKTIEIPAQYDNGMDVTAYVVPDMATDARVKNRDIVAGGNARFYAGVPIRSPQGHAIGSYCIIDDKPREGLTHAELAFLKDMATVIMVHLDRTRASEASLRSERMLRGLGSFVEGNYAVQDWWMSAGSTDASHSETLREAEMWSDRQFATHNYDTPDSGPDTLASGLQPSARPETASRESMLTTTEHDKPGVHRSTSDVSIQPLQHDPAIDQQTTNKQQEVVTDDVKSTFSRAANLIRDVTGTEEAIFFDASIGSFGGLVDYPQNADPGDLDRVESNEVPHADSDTEGSVTSTTSLYERQIIGQLEKPCEVLAFSSNDKCSLDGHVPPETTGVMTEGFLKSLLERYPHGKIFNLDEDSDIERKGSRKGTMTPSKGSVRSSKGNVPRFSRRNEAPTLRRIFPHVRSLAIVPIFDASKDKWFAGGIVWTTDPMRVLSSKLELSYLAAFGNSIMAEVHRLEAKRADFAKTKFIGSVSHELRSPLHGILGSVECLQDTELDAFQENLVHTVETCGKTLLDTIDHLLDFAKINNFTSSARDNKGGRRSSAQARSEKMHNEGDKKKHFALDVDVDLSVITEEVMETVYAGHDFTILGGGSHAKHERTSAASAEFMQNLDAARNAGNRERKVSIVLDIDKAAESHWIFRTQAGAWRRIIMNLFGNALKYTDEGFIQVRLTAFPLPNKERSGKSEVNLVVTDSGKGISKEYLENQLFTPFAQENTLAPGTGLGLSIVKQIVQGMGGSIDVVSEQGRGTEITVTMSMYHAPRTQSDLEQSIVASTARDCRGLRIGFLGFGADTYEKRPTDRFRDAINSKHHFMNSFHKLCKNWFDMNMFIINHGLDEREVDIFLITEEGADNSKDELARQFNASNESGVRQRVAATPLLVMCDAASTAQAKLQTRGDHQIWDMTEFIAQPCGPRKLAKALALCLERRAAPLALRPAHRNSDAFPSDERTRESRQPLKEGIVPSEDHGQSKEGKDEPSAHPDPSDEVPRSAQLKGKVAEQDLHSRDSVDKTGNDVERSSGTSVAVPSGKNAMVADRPKAGKSIKKAEDSSAPKCPPRHVLLVDDNNINLQLLVNYMKKNKHTFVTAMNGQEAVDAFKASTEELSSNPDPKRERPFDYILMDLSMPVMDGLEATRNIRSHERKQHLLKRSNNTKSAEQSPKSEQTSTMNNGADGGQAKSTSQAETGATSPEKSPSKQARHHSGEDDFHPATVIALTGLASAQAQQEAYSSGIDIFMTKPVRLAELSKIMAREHDVGS